MKRAKHASRAEDLAQLEMVSGAAARSVCGPKNKRAQPRPRHQGYQAKYFQSAIALRFFLVQHQAPNEPPFPAGARSIVPEEGLPHSRKQSKECWPRRQKEEAKRF